MRVRLSILPDSYLLWLSQGWRCELRRVDVRHSTCQLRVSVQDSRELHLHCSRGDAARSIGTQVDPDFRFFEIAGPYAKRFMFMSEGRYLRGLLVDRVVRGEKGEIEWEKVWKLAKMAFK